LSGPYFVDSDADVRDIHERTIAELEPSLSKGYHVSVRFMVRGNVTYASITIPRQVA